MDSKTTDTSFTSELTRKLVDDATIFTRFSQLARLDQPEEEDRILDALIQKFESLNAGTKQELVDLGSLLNDERGQAIRAAVCRPGRAEIAVSADGMEATLTLHKAEGGGKALSTADVVSLLKDHGVVFGVDLQTISMAVNDVARGPQKKLEVRAAVGREPVNGASGKIAVTTGELIAGQGSNRRQQWMVKGGDVLGRTVAPTSGTVGMDVYGHEVAPQPGKDGELATGLGVTRTEDGNYVADFDGLALFDSTQLELRRQLVWKEDLTVHDPPIRFDGSVVIHGSVRDGVTLHAKGDIEIHGGIEGASVVSAEGAVLVRQGIAGRGRSFVSAKRLLDAKYIENGTVFSEGDIIVRHAVIHSKLTAGQKVAVALGKGAVFGGEIRAGTMITAKSFGNVTGIPTKVSVGHEWVSLRKIQDSEADLASLRQASAMCEELIMKFRRARPQLTSLGVSEKKALGDLLKHHVVLCARITSGEAERQRLDDAWSLRSGGDICCLETLFAGVTVKMGSATVLTSVNNNACTLRFDPEQRRIVAVTLSGRKGCLG